MLYIPFNEISALSDFNLLLDPNRQVTWYDPNGNTSDNDARWRQCFLWHIRNTPHRFPPSIFTLFYGITEEDFNVTINPDQSDSDGEWDPTPEITRRQEQEWERVSRLPLHGQGQMGQPREFFGTRDMDLQHDWNSDLQEFDLVPNLDTFVA
jgi:hypothetical protein